MRLRTKLVIGFLTSPLFFALHSTFSYMGLSTIREDILSLRRFVQTTDLMSQTAAQFSSLAHPEEIEIGVIQAHAREGEVPAVVNALNERVERARIHLHSLARLAQEPRSKKAVATTLEDLESYRKACLEFADAIQNKGPAGARGPERRLAVEHFERLGPSVARFTQSFGEETHRAVAGLARSVKVEATSVAMSSLLGVSLLTIVFAFILASLSARSILKLHRATRQIEAGDLNVTLPVSSTDEIGELTRAFNDMTRRLRETYQNLEEQVRVRTEELRQREAELYKTQKLAALGRLSAGVAHELGSPLTIIATAAEGLMDRFREARLEGMENLDDLEELQEDFSDYLPLIEAEAYRLKKVLRRLLDYARPKKPELVPLNLVEVVQNAVELARLDPRARRVDISLNEINTARIMIRGDDDRLQELTLNLLFNALDAVQDYDGEGKAAVKVSLKQEPHEATLVVEDNGMGMAPEQLSQIFEPFFTTKVDGAGTGLGLALVAGSVEAHGGHIEAKSAGQGQGSAFLVHLPLA